MTPSIDASFVGLMSFTASQRYAIFTVHGERCGLCREPLFLRDMEVDHIIPASLAGTPHLEGVLTNFGLPPDFDLNSYKNLLPAHRVCNGRKCDVVLNPVPFIVIELQKASVKAAAVVELERKTVSDRKIDEAISVLCRALDADLLGQEHRKQLSTLSVFHEAVRPRENRGQPFMLAPWLTVVSPGSDYSPMVLRGPSGMIGSRPHGDNVHPSWDCPNCGPTGWNGARCIFCGMMDED